MTSRSTQFLKEDGRMRFAEICLRRARQRFYFSQKRHWVSLLMFVALLIFSKSATAITIGSLVIMLTTADLIIALSEEMRWMNCYIKYRKRRLEIALAPFEFKHLADSHRSCDWDLCLLCRWKQHAGTWEPSEEFAELSKELRCSS